MHLRSLQRAGSLAIVLVFVLSLLPLPLAASTTDAVQTIPSATYSEPFDVDTNWATVPAGGSMTSYGTKTYSNASHPEVQFQADLGLRQTSATQDGFPAIHSGTYSWRLQNAANALWKATVTTGGVGTFSLWVRRWDNTPDPNYVVEYSIDNGTNWTSVQTINNAWLVTSDWKQVSGTINAPNTSGSADDIIIRVRYVTGERLMVDDFEMTDYAGTPVETAPSVASVSPANSATNVALNATVTATFNENVAFNSTVEINCSVSGVQTVTPTGGPATWTLPHTDFQYNETCTVTIDATDVSDVDTNDPPDNMAAAYIWSFSTPASDPCIASFTPIYTIQGSGATAAVTGAVTTQGVVVGDYELPAGSNQIRGFYLQDPAGDGDPATSDGIFVYNGGVDTVSIGQVVRVAGTAAEFSGQTQISTPTVTQCGATGSVTPVNVNLPLTAADDLEKYEGMLVKFPQTLYVTEHYLLGRFGEVMLSSGGRLKQPTNVAAPGAPALALQAANNLNYIIADDEINNQNPDPIKFGRGGNTLTASNTLRGADTVTNLTGVLVYDWAGNSVSPSAYRIRPISAMLGGAPNFAAANARPVAPGLPGNIRVAGANLLNYFNTFGTGACTGGVGGSATDCRGADNITEFDRQWPKTVQNLVRGGADVLAIMEMENDGYGASSAIQHIVDKLNAATAPGTYAFINPDTVNGTNSLGVDAIKVGMIYKPAKVTPVGVTSVLNSTAFVNGGDSAARNRPALAQAFEDTVWGERFIVVANHLKSKGSACDAADAGDGQGNCSIVRTNAANTLTTWLATNPTGTGDPDVLIMGDLNSYAQEDPITAIKSAGYKNLIEDRLGQDAYSYVFDGQWGYLDHALGTNALDPQVLGVEEWHINADEPSVLDYNTDFKSAGQIASLYAADEFRTSDHDPVLVGLGLYPDMGDLAAGYGAAWHTGQGNPWRLGTTWTGEATPGTDTDDGVTRNYAQSWNDGTGEVTVTVTGPAGQYACLNAWLDYSDGSVTANVVESPNGAFDANEHVVNNLPLQAGVNQAVTWPLEAGVIDVNAQYNMRFRLVPDPNNDGACGDVTLRSPLGGAQPTGRADGGEIEDYTFDPGPLAVMLASFGAEQQGGVVMVSWETSTELNNRGFNLYRSTSPSLLGQPLNSVLIPSQAQGSNTGFVYTWQDQSDLVVGTTYYYSLVDVNLNGATTLHGPVSVTIVQPTAVTLSSLQASPMTSLFPLALALAGLAALLGVVWMLRR